MTPTPDPRAIALAEFAYWRRAQADTVDMDLFAMGASAAASNIYAALAGHPAPWHVRPEREDYFDAEPTPTEPAAPV